MGGEERGGKGWVDGRGLEGKAVGVFRKGTRARGWLSRGRAMRVEFFGGVAGKKKWAPTKLKRGRSVRPRPLSSPGQTRSCAQRPSGEFIHVVRQEKKHGSSRMERCLCQRKKR